MSQIINLQKPKQLSLNCHLTQYGGHSLAYHSLQPELSQFITNDGYIAYIDYHNETIVLGDPISKTNCTSKLIREFLQFKQECSFIQISQKTGQELSNQNFDVNYFGVESELPLPYRVYGKQKREIRNLRNSAIRNKIQVREITNRTEIYSDDFFKDETKEYSFLSRSLRLNDEVGVRIFGAYHNAKLVGFSLFDPMYSCGDIFGYAEVISRQSKYSQKGTRTYTLLESMNHFFHEGVKLVNIGLLPFYPDDSIHNSVVPKQSRMIDFIFASLYKTSPLVSNFEGLSFHKSRYRGNLIPRYFASNSKNPLKALLCIYKLTTGNWIPRMII